MASVWSEVWDLSYFTTEHWGDEEMVDLFNDMRVKENIVLELNVMQCHIPDSDRWLSVTASSK